VTVSEELPKYKLDLVGVQEERWEGSGTEPVGEYTFFYGKENENHELCIGLLCIRESYQQLRWLSLLVIHNTKRSLVSYQFSERSCPNKRCN
jgi:hypothetical protein